MLRLFVNSLGIRIKKNEYLYQLLVCLIPLKVFSVFYKFLGIYPSVQGGEIRLLKQVLISPHWNITSINATRYKELESKFAKYTGSEYAIAVSGGGVGIVMTLRALGLKPGSTIAHQVDTCNAVPQSILNAHFTPVFRDISLENNMLNLQLANAIKYQTNDAMIATHMWGYYENINGLLDSKSKQNQFLVEDCCLALGLKIDGEHVGNQGIAGIFSFGASKPTQAGEGGMIITNNQELAKELKIIRNWGEEIGQSRDLKKLSINGRLSETTSALATLQLESIDKRVTTTQNLVRKFNEFLSKSRIFRLKNVNDNITNSIFTRIVLEIKRENLNKSQNVEYFLNEFRKFGVGAFYANFEPLTELTLFKNGDWQNWCHNLKNTTIMNNQGSFPNAYKLFKESGISLPQEYFRNNSKLEYVKSVILKIEKEL